MDRRRFLATSVAGALAGPLDIQAQTAARVYRIGYLGPSQSSGRLMQAFDQGLRELGYVDGTNCIIERRYTDADGNLDDKRLAIQAEELVRFRPDVLVVSITEAALAARNATTTIPIVMANVADPVGNGLVASLARPGGNLTGLSRLGPDLAGKTLALLKEAVPKAANIAVLSNPLDPVHPELLTNTKRAARALGVQLKIVEARTPDDLERAFAMMAKDGVAALLVLPDGMFYINRARIAGLALRGRLPSMFGSSEMAEAGGLMGYAPSSADNYRRAAIFVDKILRGAKPADLPVEQPTKFELVINLKIAKALGLTIPPSLLARADQVIE